MSSHYFLYTVRGGREPFYAAVDRETGRVWTSPTRDGAQRQAVDAGLNEFTERIITRAAFLESMGIEQETAHPIEPDRMEYHAPPPADRSATPWFSGGDGSGDASASRNLSLPRNFKSARKIRPGKGKSPFMTNRPITPSSADAGETSDDILIVPASHDAPSPPPRFSDTEAVDPHKFED